MMATGRAGLFLVLAVVISNFRTHGSSFSVKWAICTSYLVLSYCTEKMSMQKCGCTERLFRHYVRLLSFEEIVLDESFRRSDWHTHASRAIDRWPKNKIKRVAFEFQFSPSKREKHPWRWTDCTNLHLFTSTDIFRRLRGKSIFNIYQFLSENCFLVTPLKPKIKISVTLSINHPDLVSRIRVVG